MNVMTGGERSSSGYSKSISGSSSSEPSSSAESSCREEEVGVSSSHTRTPSASTTDSENSEQQGILLSIANLSHSHGQNTQQQQQQHPPAGKDNLKEGKTSGSINSSGGDNVVDELRGELKSAMELLKEKDLEIQRLSKIRDEVEGELEDLTASLFEEAHKMVREANVKAATAEKAAVEAKMQIDGLTTEVSALKVMVLTSTPSHPNKHLHPQLNDTKSKTLPQSSSISSQESGEINEEILENKLNIDPILRKEYLSWKKNPSLKVEDHPFLDRLYNEDIHTTLNFINSELGSKVTHAIQNNNLSISPISKEELKSKQCALIGTPMLCKYRMKFLSSNDDENPSEEKDEFFDICQLSRNRIISVCDLINYLRYVTQGLVKSHANDVYWEIMQLRKKILLARLGFTPD